MACSPGAREPVVHSRSSIFLEAPRTRWPPASNPNSGLWPPGHLSAASTAGQPRTRPGRIRTPAGNQLASEMQVRTQGSTGRGRLAAENWQELLSCLHELGLQHKEVSRSTTVVVHGRHTDPVPSAPLKLCGAVLNRTPSGAKAAKTALARQVFRDFSRATGYSTLGVPLPLANGTLIAGRETG